MPGSKWICCQLGAREHYAIPRALHAEAVLAKLITDFWLRPQSTVLRITPSSLLRRFHGRYHPELANANVDGLNFSAARFELLSRTGGQRGWPQIIARNQWFQRKAVAALSAYQPSNALLANPFGVNTQPILFSYSYAALKLLKHAKERGWRTVLGQIDPGPVEEEIVAAEVKRELALGAQWQPAPERYWREWRRECDLADYIVVNSQWSLTHLSEAGVPTGKLRLIPLAFEPRTVGSQAAKSYPKRFTMDRPLRVLFLGQINLRKGVARLLQAMRALRDEPIELIMAGPIQLDRAKEAASDCRVRWAGPVPCQSTETFYREADVFILPTLSDGFALTQLEAITYRLPVIASPRCGEVVQHGVNGLMLEEPSAAAIEEALRFCVNHPEQLAKFSDAAVVTDNFSLEKLGDRLHSCQTRPE